MKDFLAALRLADAPADEMSWFRLLQLAEGVGPGRSRRVLDSAARPGDDGGRAVGAVAGGRGRAAGERTAGARRRSPGAIRAAGDTDAAARAAPPTGCARRSIRWCARTTPTARSACRTSTALVTAAGEAPDLRTLLRRGPARPAGLVAGPGRSAPPRRGLARALDRALRQGPRVAVGAPDRRLRRQLPGRHGGRQRGEHRRGAARCCTWRSRVRGAACASTSPHRYYHRPGGSGDTHGYGKISRFLDGEVQGLFDVVAAPGDSHRFAPGPTAARACASTWTSCSPNHRRPPAYGRIRGVRVLVDTPTDESMAACEGCSSSPSTASRCSTLPGRRRSSTAPRS